MKTRVIGAALLLAGLVGVAVLWRFEALETEAPAPARGERAAVAVETAPVGRRDMRDLARFSGTLEPRVQLAVAARVGGLLEQLSVDIGDSVSRGQVVARIDDEEARQLLAQARAELAVAEAQLSEAQAALTEAQRGLERTERLSRQGAASASQLDAARTQAESQSARVALGRAQIEQREASVRAAEIRLSYTLVQANWEGEDETRVVASRYTDQGTLVSANQHLLTLVSRDPVLAVVFATERVYGRLSIGQSALVTTAARPGQSFEGVIRRIAPVFDASSRQARIEIELPNPDGLLTPGAFARAEVVIDRHGGATVVPTDAIVERDGRTGVFRIDDDQARFIPVRTGIEEAGWVQIVEPDLAGEVVTLGQHLLGEDSEVRVTHVDGVEFDATSRGMADGGGDTGE